MTSDPPSWGARLARITAHAGLRLSAQSRVDGSTVGLRWIAVGRENGSFRGVQISGSAGRLRCSTDVAMVEATDFAKRHDPPGRRPFDGPPVGPRLCRTDRLLWVWLARVWTGWRAALVIVAPDTVLRWQRRRFRAHWTTLSRRPTGGRPSVPSSRPWSPAGRRPIRSEALRESMGSSGSSTSTWPSALSPG